MAKPVQNGNQSDRKSVTSPTCPMDKGHLFGTKPKSLSQIVNPQFVNGQISENTKIFSVVSFLTDLSSEMIFPLLPIFLKEVLFASEFEIGLVEAAAVGSIGLFSLLSIYFINKLKNEKNAVIFGYSISSLVKFGFAFATNWIYVLGIRFFERMGKGIRDVARDTLIVVSENKKNLGKAFGIRETMDTTGAILGPLIAGILLLIFASQPIAESYKNIFLIAAVVATFSVPLLFFVKQGGENKKVPLNEVKNCLFNEEHNGTLVMIAFLFFTQVSLAFFILRTSEFLELWMVPIAYLTYNVLYAIFCLPAGQLVDAFGARKVLLFGLILYITGLVLFGFFPTTMTIFIGFALIGVFEAILKISTKIVAINEIDHHRYDVVFSVYRSISTVIRVPSTLIAGLLYTFTIFGSPATFIFGIICSLVCIKLVTKENKKE